MAYHEPSFTSSSNTGHTPLITNQRKYVRQQFQPMLWLTYKFNYYNPIRFQFSICKFGSVQLFVCVKTCWFVAVVALYFNDSKIHTKATTTKRTRKQQKLYIYSVCVSSPPVTTTIILWRRWRWCSGTWKQQPQQQPSSLLADFFFVLSLVGYKFLILISNLFIISFFLYLPLLIYCYCCIIKLKHQHLFKLFFIITFN